MRKRAPNCPQYLTTSRLLLPLFLCRLFLVRLAFILSRSGHGHSHGIGGGHGHSHGGSGENINVRAALIHVIGDIVQSVGVVIAGALIWYNPDWHLADPITTFLFSILVVSHPLPVRGGWARWWQCCT